MKKNIEFLWVVLVSVFFPYCGAAQTMDVDVHVGANLSGFTGGKSQIVQNQKMTVGSSLGTGFSLETKNKMVLSTGIDLLMLSGKYSVMSDFLIDGKLEYVYPSVKSRDLSLEIPLKIGYDFQIGSRWNLIPSVGVYGRYSFASIKENVTENFVGDKPNTFKWDCFENHINGNNRLNAYKRWDVGALVEAKIVYNKHYSMALGYSRGFINKSSQYNIKNHGLRFALGYSF